jgi:hypothetical protein
MKSFRLAALLFLMAAVFSSCESKAASNTDNSGDVKRSFKVNKGGLLKVSINTGDVTIEPWNKNEVFVRVGDVDEGQNSLSIYQSGNNVTVQYNGSGYYNNSDVKVYVPAEFNLDLRSNQGDIIIRSELKGNCQVSTGGGDITIGNLSGYVNVKTNGGDVIAGNINGDLTLATNGGDITVANIAGKGDIQTNGGEIKIGNVGKYLSVKTYGGDITTGDIGGNADVSTMGGSIYVRKVSGSASLKTNGGDVKILGSWGTVYARTYGGSIYLYNINGSINASTSTGEIHAELKSVKGSSKLESLNGSVRLYIDPNVKATIYANVNLGGWGGSDEKPIISEFPVKSYDSGKNSSSVNAVYKINGGGDAITIKTINDGIELHKLRK